MNLIWLLILTALAAPRGSAAVQSAVADSDRFMALHRQWRETHLAVRRKAPVNALLVFDPGRGQAWIDRDGQIDAKEREPLPTGLEWSAYLISDEGATEIPFPVRLNRPRVNIRKGDLTEEILIVGAGQERSWCCSIATTEGGHVMHAFGGSRISSFTFRKPPRESTPKSDERRDSMLVPEENPTRKWADSIRNKHFSIAVIRTTAQD